MTHASPAVEEILEQIQRLEESSGAARTKILGERLNLSLGTVTNTLSRLQRLGLARRVPYKGTQLTTEGRKVALSVLRRHRLLERLLTDVLHIQWNKAHDVACKLEHCVGDEVSDAIDTALAYPRTCPHGNPIPRAGTVPREASRRLTELAPHDAGSVVRIVDEEEKGALTYLHSVGLIPGAEFTVKHHEPFDGGIVLGLRNSRVAVAKKAALLVAVKKRNQGGSGVRRTRRTRDA